VLAGAFLMILLLVLYRGLPATADSVLGSVSFVVVGGLAAFLIMTWLQNVAWGLVAGLLLALHPYYLARAASSDPSLIAQALVLLVVAGVTAGCRLTFLPVPAWRTWLAVAVVLLTGTALTWPIHPRFGFLAALLICPSLLAGATLAARLRQKHARLRPSGWNIFTALLVGITVPVISCVLAFASVRYLDWQRSSALSPQADAIDLFQAGIDINWDSYRFQAWRPSDVQRWAWPDIWVAGLLMVWGCWRSIRRGWGLWAIGQPPMAWVLLWYGVLTLLATALHSGPTDNASVLALAGLSVLLAVFGVADVIRGIMERLILAPPQERE
jgi:hypothetical protein